MKLLFYIVVFSAFIASLVCVYFFDYNNKYYLMSFFPIIYVVHFIFILNTKFISNYPITYYSYIILQYIRFVIMPPLILTSSNPGYQHLEPELITIFEASFYMLYELLFLTIFIKFLQACLLKKQLPSVKNLYLKGSKIGYILFVIFGLSLYMFYPDADKLINFIYIPISLDDGQRLGDLNDTRLVLIRQIFIISVIFMFFLALYYSKKKYFNKRQTIFISLIFAILTVLIIVGERRTAQIYSAFSAVCILIALFPYERKKVFISILLPATFVLLTMSIYKFYSAFMYDSYSEALNQGGVLSSFPSLLQIYFFGPQNIALSLDFASKVDNSIFGLLYDFFRSIFGLSFVLKNEMELTSVRFNQYIYGSNVNTGQVLSSFSYGAIYLGVFAAPVITCINLVFSVIFEFLMKISKSIEFYYIFSIAVIRFSTNIFGPLPALISYVSILLGIMGLICLLFILLKEKVGVK